MESELNKNNNSERSYQPENSYQPDQPLLCTNECGFFGAASSKGLCSKCYYDLHIKEEAKAALVLMNEMLQSAVNSSILPASAVSAGAEKVSASGRQKEPCNPNRCGSCNKKVGLATRFQCKCGITYCGTHRYPEAHECTFDFKAVGREKISNENPIIQADKQLDRI